MRGHPAVHELKCDPVYFEAVRSGRKSFELRRDDRSFAVGDTLMLREFDRVTQTYSGRRTIFMVGYILRGSEHLAPGYCAIGLALLNADVTREPAVPVSTVVPSKCPNGHGHTLSEVCDCGCRYCALPEPTPADVKRDEALAEYVAVRTAEMERLLERAPKDIAAWETEKKQRESFTCPTPDGGWKTPFPAPAAEAKPVRAGQKWRNSDDDYTLKKRRPNPADPNGFVWETNEGVILFEQNGRLPNMTIVSDTPTLAQITEAADSLPVEPQKPLDLKTIDALYPNTKTFDDGYRLWEVGPRQLRFSDNEWDRYDGSDIGSVWTDPLNIRTLADLASHMDWLNCKGA